MCLLTKFRRKGKKIKEKASKLTREASVVVVAVVVKLQDNKLDEGNILKAQGFFFTSHIFTIKLASKVRRRRKKVCVYEKVSKTLSLSLFSLFSLLSTCIHGSGRYSTKHYGYAMWMDRWMMFFCIGTMQ